MRRCHLTRSIAILACLVGLSCDSDRESSTIATSEMRALFLARSTGVGKTRLNAELQVLDVGPIVSFWENVNLNGGDRLIATSIDPETLQETEKVMLEGEIDLDTGYGAGFTGREKDRAFEIVFDRSASGQASAGVSRVTLPSPFELDWVADPLAMTPAPIPFSRSSATPYFVVWDPFGAPDFEPGDQLLYEVAGNCIETRSGVLDWEAGEDALELTGALTDVSPPSGDGNCRVRVELTLRRTGTVAAAYDSGRFHGEQVRVLTLESTP